MQRFRNVLAALVIVLIAGPAAASSFIETFDGGSNVGGWTFYSPYESIPQSGGNPGAYLRADDVDTYAPWLCTAWGGDSIFTGNYRALNVSSIGVDLAVFYVGYSAAERNCTIMLRSDNGTPWDFEDDWVAFKLGPFIPEPGDGWRSFDFEIPSQETEWPAGWHSMPLGMNAPEPDWNDLMNNVAELGFHFGDPELFYIFQIWGLGVDNPRITTGTVAVRQDSWTNVKSMFR
jgi:hypothetical protein